MGFRPSIRANRVNPCAVVCSSVGPRLPAGLQEVARAAAEVPGGAHHGSDGHGHAARPEGHPQPAADVQAPGVGVPAPATATAAQPSRLLFNCRLVV